MSHLPDDPLSRALAELPRARASDGFTSRVLARLDEPHSRRRLPLARLGLAAAALGAALVLLLRAGGPLRPAADPEAVRVAQLRAEYRQIESELAELRRLADETAPILYLNGTDQYDVVLDLRPMLASRSHPQLLPQPARNDG